MTGFWDFGAVRVRFCVGVVGGLFMFKPPTDTVRKTFSSYLVDCEAIVKEWGGRGKIFSPSTNQNFVLSFLYIFLFDNDFNLFNFYLSPLLFKRGRIKRGNFYYICAVTKFLYIMSMRKVSVCIYQYPKDYLSSFSIRHLFEVNEELIYNDKYLSDLPLYEILQMHVDHIHDYAIMCETEHCFRIVVRDSEDRISISFRA